MLITNIHEMLNNTLAHSHIWEKELSKRKFYDLSNDGYLPHRTFHRLGKTAHERAFFAGNRTGKTHSASKEIRMHATGEYIEWWDGYRYNHPVNVWICGVSSEINRELERRYFEGEGEDPPWIPSEYIMYENKSQHLYKIKHASGGASILQFKTYEQGRAKFQAAKVHIIHFDEEPPMDIYMEGLTRTVSTSPNHHGMVILTATPLMGMTNMMLHYLTRKDTDTQISPEEVRDSRVYVMAGWENAPHINTDEQKRLISSYAPHEIESRTKGIPSLGSGMVYPVPESLITCDPFQIPEFWPRVFGLDFGWKDPTAALFAAHDRDNDIVYIYGEYAVSELTPQHHANELLKQGAGWIPGVYDPSGNQTNQKDGSNLADLYRQSGLRNLSKADNAREEGILNVLQRMQNNKLYLFSSLHKTLREYRMYARKDGIIKDGNDHLMDCLRYIIMSGLPVARTKDLNQMFDKFNKHRFPQKSSQSWMKL